IKTVLEINEFANFLEANSLVTFTQKFINKNFIDIFEQSEQFKELNVDRLRELISLDQIETEQEGEQTILKIIMNWINFDPHSRKSHLSKLLEEVRFSFINQERLLRLDDEFPLLKTEAIFKDLIIEAMKYQFFKDKFSQEKLAHRKFRPRGHLKC